MPVVRMAKLTGLAPELVMPRIPAQQCQRHGAIDQHEKLGETNVVFFHDGSAGQKFARKSIPAYK